ncbi:MAG: GTP-binding protein [Candidatus Vogelbacteria bacterium]|nr:GTP-binding protein [Candidatus Vogelbacteria bacterium]
MKTVSSRNRIARPPIVVVVGHIDHGKSSLLDYIRKTNVVAGETGGITQHISAYEAMHNGRKITFLDTPGHEAFAEMRLRGAHAADIAILVIGADDGVEVQTTEALRAIQEAGIPYVVAINKMDLPTAEPERVKQQLAEQGVFLEGYGGTISNTAISAKTGAGVSELLDLVLLATDIEDLTAEASTPAGGHVIESHMDPKRGATATLIITNGIITKKGFVVAGDAYAPIRILEDFKHAPITSATVSAPIVIAGFNHVPPVGTTWSIVTDKKEAERLSKVRAAVAAHDKTQPETEIVIPILVKADTRGTLEAVLGELRRAATEKARFEVIASGVGAITENDINTIAAGKDPLVVGFSVKVEQGAQDISTRLGITPVSFSLIYELTKYVRSEIERRSPKISTEIVLGKGRILKTFDRSKEKQIVGGTVLSGAILQNKTVKIIRNGGEIGGGSISELQQSRVKVDRVEEGSQFGAQISSRITIAAGDIIEAIDVVAAGHE